MTEHELKHSIAAGEDSTRQFKRDFSNADSLAAELIAFANSVGGTLFIGVADDGAHSAEVGHLIRRKSAGCSD